MASRMMLPKAVTHPRAIWPSYLRGAFVVAVCVVTTYQLTTVMYSLDQLADASKPNYGAVAEAIETQNFEISKLRSEVRDRPMVIRPAGTTELATTGATIVDIDRDELEEMLRQDQFARGTRIVPRLTNGKPSGFKIFAIRPQSAYAKLGLKNGDTLLSINDIEIRDMDTALSAYTKIEAVDLYDIRVERKDEAHRILLILH